jgi:hypothetical protein
MGLAAKIAATGVIGLGLVGGGVFVHQTIRHTSDGPEKSAARELASRGGADAEIADRAREDAVSPEVNPAPSTASASNARSRPASPIEQSLSTEIRVLESARAAIAGHNPAAAQRALDSYAQRFPQGHLRPEASVLRLTVLVEQGNRSAAQGLAAQLLANPLYRPYEQRIRSLLREAGKEQAAR